MMSDRRRRNFDRIQLGQGSDRQSNTGRWNTGRWNTGRWNTGRWNTGRWNTGRWNTGRWNFGSHLRRLIQRRGSFSDWLWLGLLWLGGNRLGWPSELQNQIWHLHQTAAGATELHPRGGGSQDKAAATGLAFGCNLGGRPLLRHAQCLPTLAVKLTSGVKLGKRHPLLCIRRFGLGSPCWRSRIGRLIKSEIAAASRTLACNDFHGNDYDRIETASRASLAS
ncbi:pentapeptide repeat-containing protein [Stieleria bergensis]|uniref:pentapeptide repeat-containing protein n=1 Tax=Stieleria bergensis TaxID=2528025 RepID=UPI003AF38D4D